MLKYVANNVQIDESKRIEILSPNETPGNGCYGIFAAPTVVDDSAFAGQVLYMETNGDPVVCPMPCDSNYDEDFAAFLSDAGITSDELTDALGAHDLTIEDFWS